MVEIICPNCSSKTSAQHSFCPLCGYVLEDEAEQISSKERQLLREKLMPQVTKARRQYTAAYILRLASTLVLLLCIACAKLIIIENVELREREIVYLPYSQELMVTQPCKVEIVTRSIKYISYTQASEVNGSGYKKVFTTYYCHATTTDGNTVNLAIDSPSFSEILKKYTQQKTVELKGQIVSMPDHFQSDPLHSGTGSGSAGKLSAYKILHVQENPPATELVEEVDSFPIGYFILGLDIVLLALSILLEWKAKKHFRAKNNELKKLALR